MGIVLPVFHTVRTSLWWYSKLIIILHSPFFLNRFSLIFFCLWVCFYVSMGIIKTSNTFLSDVPNWVPHFSTLLISQPPSFYCINKDRTKQRRVDKENNIKLAHHITSCTANTMNASDFREEWKCEEGFPLVS